MSSTPDVLAHAIQFEQHHTIQRSQTFTPTFTSHVEFHQPERLTAVCEEEEDDDEDVYDVELEQVSIAISTSMDMDEPLIKPTSTSTSSWSTSRIFTSSSIPLPALSWPSWLFLMTLMLTQTCITCYGYATGTSQYALYLPLHLLPSIILLRWWLDTASTPTSPVLISTITSSMERLSPYDSLIRAYATGFILISAFAITFQSTVGHMLLNSFITYIPAEQHHYYFVWVGMVSMILAVGEEGMKYIIASRVLTVNTTTGNKLPIMSLTAGTLGCVTACSLFFTVADMFASTPVTQLLSFHYSLLAMLPVHCCTATFIGLSIAYRRLVPESWTSPTHVLLLPIGLRLAITLMYFTYIMLFTTISHFFTMICQMIIICTVVLQLPYAVYQRYCVLQLKHVY